MTTSLFLELIFNSIQLAMTLYLVAVGVTLVFGVMNLVNLSQGSMFMLGGYFSAAAMDWTGSWVEGAAVGLVAVGVVGALIEFLVVRNLYHRNHLDQVLATFGLMLFFNEIVVIVWGREPLFLATPPGLGGSIHLAPGFFYPAYRLAISGTALAAGLLLYLLITRTRVGMLIRAGAEQRRLIEAFGVNIRVLYTLVFSLGALLAGLGGIMTAPLLPVQTGVGDSILIEVLVVIIIGGLGSIRGALVASLAVGLFEVFGHLLLPIYLGPTTGNALASMSIYIAMAAVLVWRPTGLFRSI